MTAEWTPKVGDLIEARKGELAIRARLTSSCLRGAR